MTDNPRIRIYANRWFAKFAAKEKISDATLADAVHRAETGLIDAGSRSRTRKRAIKQLYEDFFSQVQGSEMHIAVLYSDDMTDAQTLANQLKREYESAEIIIARVSPVLGVHVGPGAVGLTGYAL